MECVRRRRDHGCRRGVDGPRDRPVRSCYGGAGRRPVQRRADDRAPRCDCQFLGRLSDDRFGAELRAALEDAGVRIAVAEPTPAPTTLAIARLDALGAAEYKFYLERTSAAELTSADVPAEILDSSNAIALAGLGLLV